MGYSLYVVYVDVTHLCVYAIDMATTSSGMYVCVL